MSPNFFAISYLISAVFFILSLRGLSSASTSQKGNLFGMLGMAIAISATFFHPAVHRYGWILITMSAGGMVGAVIARRIAMTALPQLVAAFHSLVGLTAVYVAASALYSPQVFQISIASQIFKGSLFEMGLGTIIGALTFTGSLVAFGKLQGLISSQSKSLPNRHMINLILGCCVLGLLFFFVLTQSSFIFWSMTFLSFALGVLLILPIGGADMPVIVSMLNSYSGWAAAGIGFTLQNPLLIITGALVGSSGAILSYIMCKGMNRSILNVMAGGFGSDSNPALPSSSPSHDRPIQVNSPEDAAYIMEHSQSVIIVPGYGMAVAQAQHALKEMGDILAGKGISVRYAIHPVAGRMPGHMNVLLAEANVPYDNVLELDDINPDFSKTDVVLIIGANDITNPAAKTDPTSPIYGMPILDVENAKIVFFVKRSLASGYSGIDNDLFYRSNVRMVLGDGKKVCEEIVRSIKGMK